MNETRVLVWKQQPASFFERATIDIDGTIAPSCGECKEGVDRAYNGEWGYAPLMISLANTGEMLYLHNRPGNRPSHEGAFEYLEPAVELVREAGFEKARLRGDSHFSLTGDFDHWDGSGIEFVFGIAAHGGLVEAAESIAGGEWSELKRRARTTGGRGAPKPRLREERVRERGYRNLVLARVGVRCRTPLRRSSARKYRSNPGRGLDEEQAAGAAP
ncbi:hypothetical protein Pla163_06070 [Planctomycetes bacterium Pla163]|uniref:Transposase DDE domain-containing protein n=1 Tax=Rohdeia mirabilis TaxID=2528008 RepID=A0A518CWD2_9BACT|nr:hypothetical protein Pla163_06070 [Planctomycetes bacterium Pla163]